MAQFKPGQSGNPAGKPPGTISRKTKLWDELSGYLVNAGAERFKKELVKLKGKDYCDMYTKTLEYVKPKLSRQQVQHEGEIKTPVTTVRLIEVKKPDGT